MFWFLRFVKEGILSRGTITFVPVFQTVSDVIKPKESHSSGIPENPPFQMGPKDGVGTRESQMATSPAGAP
jgi:hypothetical protein